MCAYFNSSDLSTTAHSARRAEHRDVLMRWRFGDFLSFILVHATALCCVIHILPVNMAETCKAATALPSEPLLLDGQRSPRCILEDGDSFRSPGDNQRRSLCLTEDVLEHTDALGSSSFLRLSDVIGARAESMAATRRDGHDQATHRLQVYAYIRWEQGAGKGCMGSLCHREERRAAHQAWLVSSASTAERWATAINDILKSCGGSNDANSGAVIGPGRRLLVLINPVSGTGGSRSAWEETLRPMLEEAMATFTAIISTRRGELAEVINNAGAGGGNNDHAGSGHSTTRPRPAADAGGIEEAVGGISRIGNLDAYDGIVVVGGDGTLHEVLQGMYARPDGLQHLSRLSLGVVPGGTGNGLAKTVTEESGEKYGGVGASFLVAKGCTKGLDLIPTEIGDKKLLAFMMVGWGMVSDVDIESEAYRWVGSSRFTIGTLISVAKLRHYRGRISFIPAPGAAANASSDASPASATPFRMPPLTEPVNSVDSATDQVGSTRWTSVEGDFLLAVVAHCKYMSHDMEIAPGSRVGDGLMDLLFIKKGASRLGVIKMFLAMEKGEHISPRYPLISWHRVRAVRIEPSTPRGKLTVDGELVDYVPLQQHVLHNAANIMCSPDPFCSDAAQAR